MGKTAPMPIRMIARKPGLLDIGLDLFQPGFAILQGCISFSCSMSRFLGGSETCLSTGVA
jgi:hypothetical protein